MKNSVFFIVYLLTALSLVWFGSAPAEAADFAALARDGVVRVHVFHTDESAELHYANSGKWLSGVDDQLLKLFRSRADEKEFQLDHRLIELADHLQDHFHADMIEVICGYRSPEFNKNLKDTGHNVARESLHMKGLAMDIHIDEIREDTLRDYLLSLKLGGVGYYGSKLMVHMDFGPVRMWADGGFSENTEIGIFNTGNALKIRTDKLNYELNSHLALLISPKSGVKTLTLEKYFRGKWLEVNSVGENILHKPIVLTADFLTDSGKMSSPYGKYRFHWLSGPKWQNSNEFYVKAE